MTGDTTAASPPLLPHDEAMMSRALDLARAAAAAGEVPVGAVVYESATGRELGIGANRREAARDPMGHAEIMAIANACQSVGDWRLNHCTLVVTLEPCAMCAGAIVNARLGRVVYGCDDPKAGACRTLFRIADDPRLNHRALVIAGLRAAECSSLLSKFFQAARRQ
ncbi:MAG: nucleoside deaminase [Phycisphaerales bacterium]